MECEAFGGIALCEKENLLRKVERLQEALREIAALPCQYPDDPEADQKMALDSVHAQLIAVEALREA